ncbi:MAG: YqeG family HAD IIIA-type phosphatase [Firmicutes bacterium]|nr:YqeG family HAD IIIA-type phosphatase [Bacillota bacterium]
MLKRFFPDIYIRSIFDLPVEQLWKKGIRALMFDIDNTVVPYDVPEPTPEHTAFFKGLMKWGFKICFVSNNSKERVEIFNRSIGGYILPNADKPGKRKILAALRKMGETPQSAALVGDQVFTDMWCAHRTGLLGILVVPVSNRDQFVTKIKRGLERGVLRRYFMTKGDASHDRKLRG